MSNENSELFNKIIEKSGVDIGDVFYHIDAPTDEWEVINIEILGSVYFWLANYKTCELRMEKRSKLFNENRYHEYFRTELEARKEILKRREQEIEEMKFNIQKLEKKG
jgi:hypothetical protein